ncbi:MAG: FxsA family protein [Mariprofundaceae bacterium]
MIRIFFALLICLPLAELYVLIEVGSEIGGVGTILICLLTAIIGGSLVRLQGLQTLLQARKAMQHGETPAVHALHGLALAMAGLMLLTPGFITDILGFMMLVPALRALLFRYLLPEIRKTSGHWIEAEVIHEPQQPDHSHHHIP